MQGLENIYSTCAINSLIQIICRTKKLRNAILYCNNIQENTLTNELKDILNLMYIQNHSISPKRFVNCLFNSFEGIFIKGEQIDICELWIFLFDKLANETSIELKELKEFNEEPIDDDLSNEETIKYLQNKCDNIINRINNNKKGELYDIVQGIMLNIIKCKKCNNILYNFEPFTNIQLDIINNTIPSIAQMFRNYLTIEEKCDDWLCEKCNEKTRYLKMTKIWKLPEIIIFNIKRFSNISSKNREPIRINKCLSIKKNSVLTDKDTEYNYKISSLGLHYGNINSGHYCAISNIKEDNEENDKYVLYDDLSLSIIENPDMLFEKNSDAYMVVYSKN